MPKADKEKFDVENPGIHPLVKEILEQIKNVFELEDLFITTTS